MQTVRFSNQLLLVGLIMALATFNSYGQSSTSDKGVMINGVKWATSNVAAPGTFAANPEDAGMFYQWNRKTAWPTTGAVSGWNNTTPTGTTWTKSNDPSPTGWRVPTIDEIKKLLDTDRVRSVWTTQNGINGRKFTDQATGNSIFLPAAGARYHNDGTLYSVGSDGSYWGSQASGSGNAYFFVFSSSNADWSTPTRISGHSVRPVAE